MQPVDSALVATNISRHMIFEVFFKCARDLLCGRWRCAAGEASNNLVDLVCEHLPKRWGSEQAPARTPLRLADRKAHLKYVVYRD